MRPFHLVLHVAAANALIQPAAPRCAPHRSGMVARTAPPLLSVPGYQTAVGIVTRLASVSPMAFGSVYGACDLLIPLNLGFAPVAGACFGVGVGTLAVVGGGSVSAAIAFWVGRLFMRERLSLWLQSSSDNAKKFKYLDRAMTKGGFRAVLLLRLIPTPVPALNYLYGITGVGFAPYMIATILGYIPGGAFAVASGAAGKQLLLMRSGRDQLLALLSVRSWWALLASAALAVGAVKLVLSAIEWIQESLDELSGVGPSGEVDEDDAGSCRPWERECEPTVP